MQIASNTDPTLATRQLRGFGALVGGGIPVAISIACALADLSIWPFALLGVLPGFILGVIFGPMAARTQTPVAAVFFIGSFGFLAALALDVAGIALVAMLPDGPPPSARELTGLQQLGAVLAWGFPVLLLGGIPCSLVVSLISVVILRRVNHAKPARLGIGVLAVVAVLVAAGAVATKVVSQRTAASEARDAALYGGPIGLGFSNSNLSRQTFEVEVRYLRPGWADVAETIGPCQSGEGGYHLQPGWAIYLRRADGFGAPVLVASSTTNGSNDPSVSVLIDEHGRITTGAAAQVPGEGDPRWQACVMQEN